MWEIISDLVPILSYLAFSKNHLSFCWSTLYVLGADLWTLYFCTGNKSESTCTPQKTNKCHYLPHSFPRKLLPQRGSLFHRRLQIQKQSRFLLFNRWLNILSPPSQLCIHPDRRVTSHLSMPRNSPVPPPLTFPLLSNLFRFPFLLVSHFQYNFDPPSC